MDLGSSSCGVKADALPAPVLCLFEVETGSNGFFCSDGGSTDLEKTVPDTITKWAAGAFCVSPVGFGVAPSVGLTVFQPFFVSLTLPYSVIRGEVFTLRASVFNYLSECIMVKSPPPPPPLFFCALSPFVIRVLSPRAGPGHAGRIGPVRLQKLRGVPVLGVPVRRGEQDLLLDRDSGRSRYRNANPVWMRFCCSPHV